ncbi:MAG: hypothetical protein FVQ81_14690 [Candidatus Glassbacteria bacterium]|nr:hypothetical protein [Candidatus Glassbacteria bacterium]
MRPTVLSALLAILSLGVGVSTAAAEITTDNIRFIEYPDFPDAHSTWGSIGYSSRYHRVFIGVTNHRDKVGLFEFDIAADSMRRLGFLPELAHLREWQWQGKVHSRITEGPDGAMYFSTDGGESREEYLMNHPQGYNGGYFMRWDPAHDRFTNLGNGLHYESIKDVTIDRLNGNILGVSYPQAHLLLYDHKRNDLRDLGRMGSDHVPRVLFSDKFGNMYYVDWRQRLIKYEHDTGQLLFNAEAVPMFEGTPGNKVITGITAFAEDGKTGVIYLVTYGSKVVAYYPRRLGFGRMVDLGGVFDGDKAPYDYYCPNLALGHNGKLYYFIGGHGQYALEDQAALMEFDPDKRTKKIVLRFPLTTISEVTGHGVTDSGGNMYFCGRRRDTRAAMMGESGASRPFMIVFNPEKALD